LVALWEKLIASGNDTNDGIQTHENKINQDL